MRYVSLFSGAGISDWGFHLAGWDCLAQVEIDKQANAVRKRHFPEVQHFTDVKEFDATQFRGVDAVIGGFPCQDYSVAGKRAGLDGDRGALWWQFHRVIRETRPRFVVGENVPGLLSSGKGLSFRTIVGSLVELGYCVGWRVLDLRYFRVPQRRRRVFIVASLGDGSCAEILFEPESLNINLQLAEPAEPAAPCLTARGCGNMHSGALLIEDGEITRFATPREAERLTGLPDDFTRWTFDGKEVADGPRYRMCGNAWAVPQAHYIAERMATVLKRERLAA